MPTTLPPSVREHFGEQTAEAFSEWLDEYVQEHAVERDEYREVLSGLDVLERTSRYSSRSTACSCTYASSHSENASAVCSPKCSRTLGGRVVGMATMDCEETTYEPYPPRRGHVPHRPL